MAGVVQFFACCQLCAMHGSGFNNYFFILENDGFRVNQVLGCLWPGHEDVLVFGESGLMLSVFLSMCECGCVRVLWLRHGSCCLGLSGGENHF